jgi:hypothetical protein
MPVLPNSFSSMHPSTSYRTHLFVHVPTLLPLPSIDYRALPSQFFDYAPIYTIPFQFVPMSIIIPNPFYLSVASIFGTSVPNTPDTPLFYVIALHTTYLQINQLVGFPADSAPSIRIGRPYHTLARMYQLS